MDKNRNKTNQKTGSNFFRHDFPHEMATSQVQVKTVVATSSTNEESYSHKEVANRLLHTHFF